MIKRDDIRGCDLAYNHHVQAEVYRNSLRSLNYFKSTWPDNPETVLQCMEQLLRSMHRDKRRDAIRTYNIINKK